MARWFFQKLVDFMLFILVVIKQTLCEGPSEDWGFEAQLICLKFTWPDLTYFGKLMGQWLLNSAKNLYVPAIIHPINDTEKLSPIQTRHNKQNLLLYHTVAFPRRYEFSISVETVCRMPQSQMQLIASGMNKCTQIFFTSPISFSPMVTSPTLKSRIPGWVTSSACCEF